VAERDAQAVARGDELIERRFTAQLLLAEQRRELMQRQRVPRRKANELIGASPWQIGHQLGQEIARGAFREPGECQVLEAVGANPVRLPVSHRGEQGDRPTLEPPRAVGEAVRGRAVEPLGVVDEERQRFVSGGGVEQAQCAHPHRERIRWHRGPECERRPQGGGLRLRQLLQAVQDRLEQASERGEREVTLGLVAGGPQRKHVVRAFAGAEEERGLADPSLARDDERAAGSRSCAPEQVLDSL
jgi:hypothetical protein